MKTKKYRITNIKYCTTPTDYVHMLLFYAIFSSEIII